MMQMTLKKIMLMSAMIIMGLAGCAAAPSSTSTKAQTKQAVMDTYEQPNSIVDQNRAKLQAATTY